MNKLILFAFICLIGGVAGAGDECDIQQVGKTLHKQARVLVSQRGFDSKEKLKQVMDILSTAIDRHTSIRSVMQDIEWDLNSAFGQKWYGFIGTRFSYDAEVNDFIKIKMGQMTLVLFRIDNKPEGEVTSDKVPSAQFEGFSLSECAIELNLRFYLWGKASLIDKTRRFTDDRVEAAIKTVNDAAEEAKNVHDVAQSVRASFDKLFGEGWICVVGTQFISVSGSFEGINIKKGEMYFYMFRRMAEQNANLFPDRNRD